MTYSDLFRSRVQSIGTNTGEMYINNTQTLINALFSDAPTYKTVQFIDNANQGLNSLNSMGVRVNNVNSKHGSSELLDDYRSIFFQDLSFNVSFGDMFVFDGYSWIVVDKKQTISKNKCSVEKCNHTLKYQDKNGILYEVPAIITDSTQYSDGIQEGKIINVLDNMLKIVVSKNTSTDILELDKRLIVDKKAWKISSISGIQDGIYIITCKSDQKNNAMDDLVDGVADKNQETVPLVYSFEYPSQVTVAVNNVVNYSFVVKLNGEVVNTPTLQISVDNSNVVLEGGRYIAKTEGYSNIIISFTGADGQEYVNYIMVNVVAEVTQPDITYQVLSENNSFELKKYCTARYWIQKFSGGYPVNADFDISVMNDANAGLVEWEVINDNSIDVSNMLGGNGETVVLVFSDLSTGSSTTQSISLSS